MDTVTQFLLGAGVASITLGPKLGWRAVLLGGAIATLPDLDSFIPFDSPIDTMTYHRGFSHSVIVQTALSPVIALGAAWFFKVRQISFLSMLATVWLCLVTHSLLDCLTTYGTQIFWPFQYASPVALPSVFIIDPTYTLLLLCGLIGFIILARRRLGAAHKFARVMMSLSCLYLLLGISGHYLIKARAEALPALSGMRVHVQPTPFNILYWQVLAVDETKIYTGVTSLLRACREISFKQQARLSAVDPFLQTVPNDVARFKWFTDGFYSYRLSNEGLEISDLRIGYDPVYPFTFRFARQVDGNWQIVPSERVAQQRRGLTYLTTLYREARTPPEACQDG